VELITANSISTARHL